MQDAVMHVSVERVHMGIEVCTARRVPSGKALMPFANNGAIRIYYDVAGTGPPLLLHHGTTGSGGVWRDLGFVDGLRHDYQVILIDGRGHGASDKPHDPAAYELRLRVSDVPAVLDDLHLRTAHYLGYSLGGWIGFGLARYAPERFTSLSLGGAHPYSENLQAVRDRLPRDLEAFIAVTERAYGRYMTATLRARLLESDLNALMAMTQDRDDISDVLPRMAMPCLLFAGDADPRLPLIQESVKHLHNATFFALPECDHAIASARSDLIVPRLREFLSALS
jgi:pimeloyl-ACP methyl ester carboxylesterase